MPALVALVALAAIHTLTAATQEDFQYIRANFAPEGKAVRKKAFVTCEQCESACRADSNCKAFAFRPARKACYFYREVFMGGGRKLQAWGLLGGGLSIVPKRGFVGAFKQSSFPAFVRTPPPN